MKQHLVPHSRVEVAAVERKATAVLAFVVDHFLLLPIGVLIAFIRNRAPRISLEVLTALIGSWLLYAAIFSQAFVIHPYLYDVLLFTPLAIALFALAPALLESLTRRTGAIVLVIFFGVYPAPILDATATSVQALVNTVTISIDGSHAAAAN